MTEEEVRALCRSRPGALETFPFAEEDTVVYRQPDGRWFAILLTGRGKRLLNLKCDPFLATVFRETVPGVSPAYHMNKTHWNSLDFSVLSEEEVARQVAHSFALTAPKRPSGHAPKKGARKGGKGSA